MTTPEEHSSWLHFSDVDTSDAVDRHARFLELLAERMAERRQRSLQALDLHPGISFLDAGCGLGELAIEIADRVSPGRVVGIDVSQELIARAVTAATGANVDVQFLVGSITALPFEDRSFDVVRSERVFQHLTAGERVAAAAELLRVLRPGGRIQLVDPNHEQWSIAADDRRLARLPLEWMSNSVRTPASGILNPTLLHDAGATDIETEADAMSIRSFDEAIGGLGLEFLLDELVSSGQASQAEMDRLVQDLRIRDASGTFLATVVLYVVTGRRP